MRILRKTFAPPSPFTTANALCLEPAQTHRQLWYRSTETSKKSTFREPTSEASSQRQASSHFSRDTVVVFRENMRRLDANEVEDTFWIQCLDEIGNVHWHLFDLSAVELLDFSHHSDIVSSDEVDGNTLSAETTTTTDTMDVVFSVGWEIVVDDQ